MLGLMVLLALGVYLAFSAGVLAWTVRWARRTGRSPWRWGIAAGLVMYLLVFWDHIPTLLLHKYYCATKAGFWVYKTPEQWKAENPGVAETLTWRENSPDYKAPGVTRGYQLNERFIWVHQITEAPLLPVSLDNEAIIDVKNGEAMAKRIRVGAGYLGGKRLFRFWTVLEPCVPGKREFGLYLHDFQQLGRELK